MGIMMCDNLVDSQENTAKTRLSHRRKWHGIEKMILFVLRFREFLDLNRLLRTCIRWRKYFRNWFLDCVIAAKNKSQNKQQPNTHPHTDNESIRWISFDHISNRVHLISLSSGERKCWIWQWKPTTDTSNEWFTDMFSFDYMNPIQWCRVIANVNSHDSNRSQDFLSF